MAEGAPLLREYRVKSLIEGSNPSLSARYAKRPERGVLRIWRRDGTWMKTPVRQNGRIAVLHGEAAPKGRGPRMARVHPALATIAPQAPLCVSGKPSLCCSLPSDFREQQGPEQPGGCLAGAITIQPPPILHPMRERIHGRGSPIAEMKRHGFHFVVELACCSPGAVGKPAEARRNQADLRDSCREQPAGCPQHGRANRSLYSRARLNPEVFAALLELNGSLVRNASLRRNPPVGEWCLVLTRFARDDGAQIPRLPLEVTIDATTRTGQVEDDHGEAHRGLWPEPARFHTSRTVTLVLGLWPRVRRARRAFAPALAPPHRKSI